MNAKFSSLGFTLAAVAFVSFPACVTSQPAQPAPEPQVQTHAYNAFSNLDEGGDDKSLENDAQEMGKAIDATKSSEAPSGAATSETTVEAPAAPIGTPSEEADVQPLGSSSKYVSTPPNAEAPVTPKSSVQEAPALLTATSSPAATCVVGSAPGKRQPSETAKQILCARAPYDLSCRDGAVDISVVSVGGLGRPWAFEAKGCGMQALYHMTGNALFFINGGTEFPKQNASPTTCTIRPYAGRQVSENAKDILCARSRADLRCPEDIFVDVLQIGLPPVPWYFAVSGCGYEVRYSMVGNDIFRDK